MDKPSLLEQLRKNEQRAINATYYRNWGACTNYVKVNQGSEQHAEDNYQDAWMVLLLNLDKGISIKNEDTIGVDAYLRGINKNLWLGHIRKRAKGDFE